MAYLVFPIILILMYLVLLRPQQQRLRAQRELVASLDIGDEIVTAGGIIGRIVDLTDERASVEVADGVVIDFLRVAVNRKAEWPSSGYGEDPGSDVDLTDTDVADLDEIGLTGDDLPEGGTGTASRAEHTDEDSR
jgi:preprotein translocase YajC subunit